MDGIPLVISQVDLFRPETTITSGKKTKEIRWQLVVVDTGPDKSKLFSSQKGIGNGPTGHKNGATLKDIRSCLFLTGLATRAIRSAVSATVPTVALH